MKKIMFAMFASLSLMAASHASKMGSEAVEVFKLMTNDDVRTCLEDVKDLVNVKIHKTVGQCPGCSTYTIEGYAKNIDMLTSKKTITLKGSSVRGAFNQQIQSYDCKIVESRL
jgi:hypothetical protein